MKRTNADMLNRLLNDSDSLENSNNMDTNVGSYAGNPAFKAQFNINVKVQYTEDNIVILPAGLPAALQNKLNLMLFGGADFSADFAKSLTFRTLTGWTPNAHFARVVGKDTKISTFAQRGDLELLFDGGTIGGKVYKAIVVINCPQIAYASLLDSINSDKLYLNTIRYKVATTATAQFSNQLTIVKQSLLGKTTNDDVDPNSYVGQMAYNTNISEIPLNIGIDKYKSLVSFINYDVTEIDMVLFCASTVKNEA